MVVGNEIVRVARMGAMKHGRIISPVKYYTQSATG